MRTAKPRRGIAAFIAFQGLLALAGGETRFPPGEISVPLYHLSSFLAAPVARTRALIALLRLASPRLPSSRFASLSLRLPPPLASLRARGGKHSE